jgi:nucleotide-binding universal stress UspA family protein
MIDERGVVVGADGAVEGLRATEWAARECERRGVPLTVVHVREHHGLSLPADERAALDAEAARFLDEATMVARTAAPDVTVRSVLADGAAAEQLVALAADAAVLAVGSRGRGGFARLALGSTGDTVVRVASSPAVLVRAGGEQSGTVVVGVQFAATGADPGDAADAVLRFAFAQAAAGPGTLTAHHSIAAPPGVVPAANAPPEEKLAAVLTPWRKEYPDVAVTLSIRVGSPAAHLVEMSDRAALLVVGRRSGGRHSGSLLGPVAHQVTHHASGAVAVVGA